MIAAHMPTLETAYFIAEWLIRLIMLVVVPLRRAPAATRSWLLLIFFLPVPGLVLYLLIGSPRFPEWRAERFARLTPFFEAVGASLPIPPGIADGGAASLAVTLGNLPAAPGNAIDFLDDYDGVIDRLVTDIDGARHHVRLLVYIFADDPAGRKVIRALARAVTRGVACHAMVDPVGSHQWIGETMRRLREAGVHAREALPFHLLRGRTRRDMRNHRKLFLIDGRIGYAGSQNIVVKDFKPGITNRELVVRIEGPVVATMTAVFLADWYCESEIMLEEHPHVPEPAGDTIAQVLPSGADYPVEGFETLLIWQIHEARRRVRIITPYLIPDEDLLGAMRTAVLRGVEVDLVVSAVADQPLVNLAQCSYYDEMLAAGVRVHLFRDYLLHAKNVSFDGGLAVVGSSNVDIRSFQLNEEVSILLHDRETVARLETIQSDCIAASDTLDLATWRARGHLRRFGENIARLVSPLL